MPITYDSIATIKLLSDASDITFSSIPGTYTDLILVSQLRSTRASGVEDYGYIFLNNDLVTSNYSRTIVSGDGSTAGSARFSNLIGITMPVASAASSTYNVTTMNFMNYSNSTTFKAVLERTALVSSITYAQVGLWRNTSTVTSIKLAPYFGPNLGAGSMATLYGVKAA